MKKVFIISMLVSVGAVMAQEVYVMSVQPRLVTVNQQQCQIQEVVRDGNNGSGTAIGAVAGGLLGSTLGGNRNDHLAGTVIGALIGGAIGTDNLLMSTSESDNRANSLENLDSAADAVMAIMATLFQERQLREVRDGIENSSIKNRT